MPDVLTQVVPQSQMPYNVYGRQARQIGSGIAQNAYGVSTPNILYQMYKRYTGQPNTLRQIPAKAFENMIPLLLGGVGGGVPEEAGLPEIPLERPPGRAEYPPGSIGAAAQRPMEPYRIVIQDQGQGGASFKILDNEDNIVNHFFTMKEAEKFLDHITNAHITLPLPKKPLSLSDATSREIYFPAHHDYMEALRETGLSEEGPRPFELERPSRNGNGTNGHR